MMKKLADDHVKFHLALSLHSAIQEKREVIMPFAERFVLDDVLEALIYWYEKTKRRVTFEYIVFNKFNDGIEDAQELWQWRPGPGSCIVLGSCVQQQSEVLVLGAGMRTVLTTR